MRVGVLGVGLGGGARTVGMNSTSSKNRSSKRAPALPAARLASEAERNRHPGGTSDPRTARSARAGLIKFAWAGSIYYSATHTWLLSLHRSEKHGGSLSHLFQRNQGHRPSYTSPEPLTTLQSSSQAFSGPRRVKSWVREGERRIKDTSASSAFKLGN